MLSVSLDSSNDPRDLHRTRALGIFFGDSLIVMSSEEAVNSANTGFAQFSS